MAITLAASVTFGGVDGGISAAIDTTGAKLLVISVGYFATIGTVSDSKGNSWTPLTERTTGSTAKHRFYYVLNPVVGTGHTFNVFGINTFLGYVVHAYANPAGALIFESQNGAAAASGTSRSTGSVTPTTDGSLIVSGLSLGDASNSPTVDSGLTSTLRAGVAGVSLGCTLAYKVQSPAAAINPTWSWTASAEHAASVAVFKSAPAFTPVASAVATGATTSAIDTTGASLLVVNVSWWEPGGAVTVSDSKGNTWQPANLYGYAGAARHRFWYCLNAVVGTGHTFTVTGQSSFVVQAFSISGGAAIQGSSQSGNTGVFVSSLASGVVTHTAGDLIVTGFGADGAGGVDTVPTGFTAVGPSFIAAANMECTGGYLVAGTTGSTNPTWALSGSHTYNVVSSLVFSIIPAGLTKIQTTGVVGAAGSPSVGVGFGFTPLVGSGIVVMAHGWNSGPMSASDNYGNTYQTAVVRNTSNHYSAILYCSKVVNSGPSFVVTVVGGGATYFAVQAHEVVGVGYGLVAVATAGATGSSTTPATGATAASPVANVFAVAVMGVQPTQSTITVETVSPVWAQDAEVLSNSGQSATEFDSRMLTGVSGATLSSSWTNGTTGAWTAIMAGFASINDLPPASGRVTHDPIEVLSLPTPAARVTHDAVEVLFIPLATARVTQTAIEVVTPYVPETTTGGVGIWMGDGAGNIWIE